VAKGCKFSVHPLKFIGVRNRNRVPSNRSVLQFGSDQDKNSISRLSKAEKENVSVRINPNSFIA
jgi:hypothetical protein